MEVGKQGTKEEIVSKEGVKRTVTPSEEVEGLAVLRPAVSVPSLHLGLVTLKEFKL